MFLESFNAETLFILRKYQENTKNLQDLNVNKNNDIINHLNFKKITMQSSIDASTVTRLSICQVQCKPLPTRASVTANGVLTRLVARGPVYTLVNVCGHALFMFRPIVRTIILI